MIFMVNVPRETNNKKPKDNKKEIIYGFKETRKELRQPEDKNKYSLIPLQAK